LNSKLADLLNELETFGQANDARETDRARRMMNITRDTGEFLLLLARAVEARRILEIGTSNGYSTLWLGEAVRPLGGIVVTIEQSSAKIEMARENFARAHLTTTIQIQHANAADVLKSQADQSFGMIFLDAERKQYCAWWNDLQRVLALGGLLVIDNAVSHARELAEFVALVKQSPNYLTSLISVGNGEFIALKQG